MVIRAHMNSCEISNLRVGLGLHFVFVCLFRFTVYSVFCYCRSVHSCVALLVFVVLG